VNQGHYDAVVAEVQGRSSPQTDTVDRDLIDAQDYRDDELLVSRALIDAQREALSRQEQVIANLKTIEQAQKQSIGSLQEIVASQQGSIALLKQFLEYRGTL
jgi:hypothetical protein